MDQWFWSLFGAGAPRLPRPIDVEEYRRCVPDDFRFTVKVPNNITFTYFRSKSEVESINGGDRETCATVAFSSG